MLAIVCDGPGGPEVLRPAEVADPQPGTGDVLIEVEAAGVNRADLLQRQGLYPPPPGVSPILGLECSGRVAAIGSDVKGFDVGDQVMALLAGGGYAQRVAVDQGSVMAVPSSWTMVEAAAFPEVYATAWLNLGILASMRQDERILVHGGSGGVGTAAIQLIRHQGAKVGVTAGGPERCARCFEAGADAAFDYKESTWPDRVRDWTEGLGPNVILDCIGGSYFEIHQHLLALDGRWCIIGLMGGSRTVIDLGRLLSRRQTLIGSTLRSRSTGQKAGLLGSLIEEFGPAMEECRVRPVVGLEMPMAEAAEAHRMMAAGEVFGKAVLTWTA
ncbi:MAG: NAD(P)H-quinone oxidoreductase [Acidobacteria bacterium]|nr:NAD(P)H-quinone oxidoreductase [Acidobacteriota bacterium]